MVEFTKVNYKMDKFMETGIIEKKQVEKSSMSEENLQLKNELHLTKSSLHSAVEDFQRVFKDQLESSEELKKLNASLVEERKQLKKILHHFQLWAD